MNNLQTLSKMILPFSENVMFINTLGKKHKDSLAVKKKGSACPSPLFCTRSLTRSLNIIIHKLEENKANSNLFYKGFTE